MRNMMSRIAILLFCMAILSSCHKVVNDNLNKPALSNEQLEITTSTTEMRLWQTNDLSIHYKIQEQGDSLLLNGYVKISDRVIYNFPRADFLYIYVYLLNDEGISTSSHAIRLNMLNYNTFREKSDFDKTIPKDPDTTSFAFGYWGNFVDTENVYRGGGMRSLGAEWQISHSPF